MYTNLTLRGIELSVTLGWPDAERMRKQMVLVDIDIHFAQPPKACTTDHLDDTYCYATLAATIHASLREKKFHLVEYLTREIYVLVKSELPNDAHITVRLTKHPMIPGLTGGICFSYGDEK